MLVKEIYRLKYRLRERLYMSLSILLFYPNLGVQRIDNSVIEMSASFCYFCRHCKYTTIVKLVLQRQACDIESATLFIWLHYLAMNVTRTSTQKEIRALQTVASVTNHAASRAL